MIFGQKVVAVVEARMGSSRLPGKTLMDVAGRPLLRRVVDRLALAATVDEVVVATSTLAGDDVVAAYCEAEGLACFRGSESDVLDRVFQAALRHDARWVVQSGADCPFYDPDLVDFLVTAAAWGGYAYAANDMELTFPEGVDAHVIAMDALAACAEEACLPEERDDTPRFIWNHPDRFPIFSFTATSGPLNRPELRLTVDYPEDMELTRNLYGELDKLPVPFTTLELVRLLDARPDWAAINRDCEQLTGAYLERKDV